MSYPVDLDEMDEDVLRKELARRLSLRRLGKCDYCERTLGTTPCKFPDRHALKVKRKKSS